MMLVKTERHSPMVPSLLLQDDQRDALLDVSRELGKHFHGQIYVALILRWHLPQLLESFGRRGYHEKMISYYATPRKMFAQLFLLIGFYRTKVLLVFLFPTTSSQQADKQAAATRLLLEERVATS